MRPHNSRLCKTTLGWMALWLSASVVLGQELPQIINFKEGNPLDFRQTWGIAQDNSHVLWLASNPGLVSFDGNKWTSYPLPNGQIARSVAVDAQGRVYVGGYGAFGYWMRAQGGCYHYVDLSGQANLASIATEEIWNILPMPNGVIFQSFSFAYFYDYQTITALEVPGVMLFAQNWGDGFVVPILERGLYKWTRSAGFTLLEGTTPLADARVCGMVPLGDGLLIATEHHGLWQYRGSSLKKWQNDTDLLSNALQWNRMAKLQSGTLALGSIQDGVFLLDASGKLLYHINQSSGLKNNTVLALYEDRAGDLWVGLDKGFSLVVLSSPLLFHSSYKQDLGTVYAAVQFQGQLYVGTNQGLYKKPQGKQQPFEAVSGSQGQVWSLNVYDNQLLCGHNNGTFTIDASGNMQWISDITGGWQFLPVPDEPGLLLQCTYTGLVLFKKENNRWALSRRIPGFHAPAKQMAWIGPRSLVAVHPSRGVFNLRLSEALDTVNKVNPWGQQEGVPSEFSVQLSAIGDTLLLYSDSMALCVAPGQTPIQLNTWRGQKLAPDSKILAGKGNNWFLASHNEVRQYSASKLLQRLPLNLVDDYPRVFLLDSSRYLFGLHDGFAIAPVQPQYATKVAPATIISQIIIKDEKADTTGYYCPSAGENQQILTLQAAQNTLVFEYAYPTYNRRPRFRYRLLGAAENWSEWTEAWRKEFSYLQPGTYVFEVQSAENAQTARFRFQILPPWYATNGAKAGYLLAILGFLAFLYRLHLRRLSAQQRRITLEKDRELAQERIRLRNEQLQADNLRKSQALANSTFNLIQKNNSLLKIKDALTKLRQDPQQKLPDYHFQKLNQLLDKHLSNQEEWVVFEENFNEVHDHFFKELKLKYPDLTPGDLKLAAYLRMNLSSKEIAPLLNISLRGVENKRYRLRTKLGLEGDDNLVEFLMML